MSGLMEFVDVRVFGFFILLLIVWFVLIDLSNVFNNFLLSFFSWLRMLCVKLGFFWFYLVSESRLSLLDLFVYLLWWFVFDFVLCVGVMIENC